MAQTNPNIGQDMFNKQLAEQAKVEKQKSEQQKCEERGGVWDTVTRTCILIPKLTIEQQAAKPTDTTDRANVKNVAQNKDGTTTLTYADGTKKTISQKEENAQNVEFAARSGLNINAIPGADVQGLAMQTQARQQQAEADRQARFKQIAQQGLLSPEELNAIQQAPIDWGQAITAGAVSAAPAGITAAAGGLLAASGGLAATGVGAPVAVGTLAAAGALYAIAKLWGGITSSIKSQQSGNIAATKDVLQQARINMRGLTMVASKDPSKAEYALTEYYKQLAQVQIAQRKLQRETQGNLNKFMDDGTQDLSDFELFLQPGGYADIQLIKLQQAINSGQPASDLEILQLYEELQANE